MASVLAKRTAHTIYSRVAFTHGPRQIHLSASVQRGWFGNLLRGSKPAENADSTETPAPKAAEDAVDPHIRTKFPEPTQAGSPATNVAPKSAPAATESTLDVATDSTPSTSETPITKKQKAKRKPLSPEKKTLRFKENIAFLEPRLGRRPQLELPKIRRTTWLRTLGVCQTEEELRKVVELFPAWRDMGHSFDESFSEAFIRRCIILKKPEIALEVFGNYAKYHVRFTLAGARELLNATYDNQPLSFVLTITGLFDVYKLPPVAQDLPCCAMVVSACLKDGSADARVVAEALVPHLKKILNSAEPQPIPNTQEKGNDMPRVWTSWALKKVDQLLFKARGKREVWLRDWRLKSGHIVDAQQF